ncbi:hypothetical protein K474DRAFT_1669179 [Panus rudis PR-1116 ss-1]|nr:hypothetical protein K474DRAFT_1669179 [Panus rudis PR-1116 ss-1]
MTPPGPAASDRSYACVPQPKLTADVTDPDATSTPTSFSCSKCEQSVHPIKFPCGHISLLVA